VAKISKGMTIVKERETESKRRYSVSTSHSKIRRTLLEDSRVVEKTNKKDKKSSSVKKPKSIGGEQESSLTPAKPRTTLLSTVNEVTEQKKSLGATASAEFKSKDDKMK